MQVFVVMAYDSFCFVKRRKPPLNFEFLISRDTFDNSLFFDE